MLLSLIALIVSIVALAFARAAGTLSDGKFDALEDALVDSDRAYNELLSLELGRLSAAAVLKEIHASIDRAEAIIEELRKGEASSTELFLEEIRRSREAGAAYEPLAKKGQIELSPSSERGLSAAVHLPRYVTRVGEDLVVVDAAEDPEALERIDLTRILFASGELDGLDVEDDFRAVVFFGVFPVGEDREDRISKFWIGAFDFERVYLEATLALLRDEAEKGLEESAEKRRRRRS